MFPVCFWLPFYQSHLWQAWHSSSSGLTDNCLGLRQAIRSPARTLISCLYSSVNARKSVINILTARSSSGDQTHLCSVNTLWVVFAWGLSCLTCFHVHKTRTKTFLCQIFKTVTSLPKISTVPNFSMHGLHQSDDQMSNAKLRELPQNDWHLCVIAQNIVDQHISANLLYQLWLGIPLRTYAPALHTVHHPFVYTHVTHAKYFSAFSESLAFTRGS